MPSCSCTHYPVQSSDSNEPCEIVDGKNTILDVQVLQPDVLVDLNLQLSPAILICENHSHPSHEALTAIGVRLGKCFILVCRDEHKLANCAILALAQKVIKWR